jgi:hypothetical protein
LSKFLFLILFLFFRAEKKELEEKIKSAEEIYKPKSILSKISSFIFGKFSYETLHEEEKNEKAGLVLSKKKN